MKGKSFYTLLILFIIILVVLFIPGYFIWLKLTEYFKADNIINPDLLAILALIFLFLIISAFTFISWCFLHYMFELKKASVDFERKVSFEDKQNQFSEKQYERMKDQKEFERLIMLYDKLNEDSKIVVPESVKEDLKKTAKDEIGTQMGNILRELVDKFIKKNN